MSMTIQIGIGTVLIVCSIVIALATFWLLQAVLSRPREWLAREPHRPKFLLVLCVTVL